MILIEYQLLTLKLLRSEFQPNPDFDEKLTLAQGGANDIRLSIKNSGNFNDADNTANFKQSFSIEGNTFMPFSMDVELEAVFRLTSQLPPEDRADCIGTVFPHAVFPYLREHVSNMTIRGGFPPMILQLAYPGPMGGGGKPGAEPVIKWVH
ncbi:MAG: protein-export chaperone SecB [Deltaproteobacteria bacterium]|jgi:preprotein translocase subunit SecB|nr:protein-export chaperone SecB [Deltaproteobacteria bacterium]